MLKANTLRGKKRRFFELIFSRNPPRSLAEAAKQAGYPPKDATAIAGHWLKQFHDLPEPMQALFICDRAGSERHLQPQHTQHNGQVLRVPPGSNPARAIPTAAQAARIRVGVLGGGVGESDIAT